ncbi:YkgJ family cysteine cluster protein [Psychromonas sp. SP041]|uniref:YkgJ family cysteine cluster protein n=1 Tax=Psychromonas sp. SP041 TaxID=1365007 RepID=UPI0010C771CE|nr:YkgJ family cysteine cluster protein [Psychromonas sp. SP041]
MKKFSCHSCAGCCHGPIALTLKEAKYQFYDDFPLVVAFVVSDVRNVPVEKDKSRYAKGMKKFTRDTIGFYDKTEDERKIVIHPQILTLVPPDSPCIHLNELNRCSIYNEKPSVCTLYPVRIDTPTSFIDEGLNRERNQAYEGLAHIPCKGWDEETNVIFKNGEPTDTRVIPLLNKREGEAKETRDLLKGFYFHIKNLEDINEKIMRYSELNIETNQFIQLPYGLFVKWLIDNNKIHPVSGQRLIDTQVSLIKSAANENKKRTDTIGNTFNSIYRMHLSQIS